MRFAKNTEDNDGPPILKLFDIPLVRTAIGPSEDPDPPYDNGASSVPENDDPDAQLPINDPFVDPNDRLAFFLGLLQTSIRTVKYIPAPTLF